MELLSEVRTPQQALNYAINRERGQADQQEIVSNRKANTSWNTVSYVRQNKPRKQTSNGQRKAPACWKSGKTFSMAHLQICPAKQIQCKICKKRDIIRHSALQKCQKDDLHVDPQITNTHNTNNNRQDE